MFKFILSALLASVASVAQVKLNVEISNANSDSIVIHNQNFKISIKANDGKFAESFNAPTGFYQFFDGAEFSVLYLDDGFELTMIADGHHFAETLSFSGIGSRENLYLLTKKAGDAKIKASFGGKLPDDETLRKILDDRYSTADKLLNDQQYDGKFKRLMLSEYILENNRIRRDLKEAKLRIFRSSQMK